MRAFIATVDLVIHADSHADAQNRLHALLSDAPDGIPHRSSRLNTAI